MHSGDTPIMNAEFLSNRILSATTLLAMGRTGVGDEGWILNWIALGY